MLKEQTILAEAIAKGITEAICNTAFYALLGALLAWLATGLTGCDMDPTDMSAWRRSGFTVMTDAKTGCEYLRAGEAITARVDGNGKQFCNKPKETP